MTRSSGLRPAPAPSRGDLPAGVTANQQAPPPILGVLVDYALTPGPAVGEPTTDWEWRYAVNSGTWSTWASVGSLQFAGGVGTVSFVAAIPL